MNRNAIIMAAGMSTRFVPLSIEKPKALLNVKGEIMIERQIRQLKEAGVDEIVIVVGYLKEKFEYLKEKYGVILIENPYYQVMNNFSTLYIARDYLHNTFVCSADNYFVENVFLEQEEQSYYSSVYVNGMTEEWCLKDDDSHKIIGVKVGGKDAWVMKGHVFLNEDFCKKLIPYLKQAFDVEAMWGKYWEDIYIEHIHELELYIKKYSSGIIEEFDSLEELRSFDSSYIEHTGSAVLAEICKKIGCKESEIEKIIPRKKNGEVIGFDFKCQSIKYEYQYQAHKLVQKA